MKRMKRGILLTLLPLLLIVGAIYHYYGESARPSGDDEWRVSFMDFIGNIYNEDLQRTLLHTQSPLNLSSPFSHCDGFLTTLDAICYESNRVARVEIKRYHDEGAECYNVSWQSLSANFAPVDCVSTKFEHWYGGSETRTHHWPIEKTPIKLQPYISSHISKQDGHGSILEPYWLGSSGVVIIAEDTFPLHVGINEEQLCLKAAHHEHSSLYGSERALPHLKYTVCAKSNALEIHRHMARRLWRKPDGIPGEHLLHDPVWSTWARYKANITQADVIQYAKEILQHGFNASYMEIDDKYTTAYGDYLFDEKKFPDAKQMTSELHQMGFRVSLWVIPYASTASAAYAEGLKKGYFVGSRKSKEIPIVRFPQGRGGAIDMTNPEAVQWLFKRLKVLRDIGVDTFKFDAGESIYLPEYPAAYEPLPNPDIYGARYAQRAYENTNNDIEVRTGYRTQNLPIITRMMDKFSQWNHTRGLRSIIPTALQFSILGYFFIMPDMIGGNAYSHRFPNKELFIRWMEIAIFLPSIQFSIAPWQYDDKTTAICQRMMRLRAKHVTPRIVQLARDSVHTGDPIIRPLWWVDPTDPKTFDVDSQFLVGDDLLVAPITEEGLTKRNIYLPQGRWKNPLRGDVLEGSRILWNYKVTLWDVAFFIRQPDRRQ